MSVDPEDAAAIKAAHTRASSALSDERLEELQCEPELVTAGEVRAMALELQTMRDLAEIYSEDAEKERAERGYLRAIADAAAAYIEHEYMPPDTCSKAWPHEAAIVRALVAARRMKVLPCTPFCPHLTGATVGRRCRWCDS